MSTEEGIDTMKAKLRPHYGKVVTLRLRGGHCARGVLQHIIDGVVEVSESKADKPFIVARLDEIVCFEIERQP